MRKTFCFIPVYLTLEFLWIISQRQVVCKMSFHISLVRTFMESHILHLFILCSSGGFTGDLMEEIRSGCSSLSPIPPNLFWQKTLVGFLLSIPHAMGGNICSSKWPWKLVPWFPRWFSGKWPKEEALTKQDPGQQKASTFLVMQQPALRRRKPQRKKIPHFKITVGVKHLAKDWQLGLWSQLPNLSVLFSAYIWWLRSVLPN